ncbi:MAG: alanine racemase [Deltaproteobacteria bacterium]|nr:alanine racemase [Deltaproteobacteria bacterium]
MDHTSSAAYFARLDALAREAGQGVPRMLVDLARVDANVDRTLRHLHGRALRLVVKSLPSVPLLARIAARAKTHRFMCFHWPFLVQIARSFPGCDVMLGKPMPVAALEAFYRQPLPDGFDASMQITWLVDSEARLEQYASLARARDLRLRIALEIDVGLHRGGFADAEALDAVCQRVRAHGPLLSIAGLMGYDAHASKAPWPRTPRLAVERSAARYAELLAHVRAKHGDLLVTPFVCNGAGSPTVTLHGKDSPLDDVSVGSALVKPSSFDLDALAEYEPAIWIATPVLKRERGIRIPFLEALSSRIARGRDTIFVYGGGWMARPAWPPGLRTSALFGKSSNQQFFSVPRETALEPDAHVFLRPTQSEAVMLELGDLLAFEPGGAVHQWPVLVR